jgi:hypothetical protein
MYAAFFNFENKPRVMSADWSKSGMQGAHVVSDLWTHRSLGVLHGIKVTVPPHGCRLLLIERNQPAH